MQAHARAHTHERTRTRTRTRTRKQKRCNTCKMPITTLGLAGAVGAASFWNDRSISTTRSTKGEPAAVSDALRAETAPSSSVP